jgi:hypothetical protein
MEAQFGWKGLLDAVCRLPCSGVHGWAQEGQVLFLTYFVEKHQLKAEHESFQSETRFGRK